MHCANITCDLYQIFKVCNLIIYARSNAEIYHRNAKEHVTNIKYKVKAIAIRGLDRLWGFHDVEASKFQDNRHMNVVRLSALHTGRLYSPGSIPGTHSC